MHCSREANFDRGRKGDWLRVTMKMEFASICSNVFLKGGG